MHSCLLIFQCYVGETQVQVTVSNIRAKCGVCVNPLQPFRGIVDRRVNA